jgi:uncharacterized membrane protein (DUF373 family)
MAVGDARARGNGPKEDPLSIALVSVLEYVERAIYMAGALVLAGIAAALLYQAVGDLVSSDRAFTDAATHAVNGVLLVVIILEIFRTMIAHLEGHVLQLRPFLVIGAISAVRHILLIGAKSLSPQSDVFSHHEVDLGVNVGVALALVIALVLVARGARDDAQPGDSPAG